MALVVQPPLPLSFEDLSDDLRDYIPSTYFHGLSRLLFSLTNKFYLSKFQEKVPRSKFSSFVSEDLGRFGSPLLFRELALPPFSFRFLYIETLKTAIFYGNSEMLKGWQINFKTKGSIAFGFPKRDSSIPLSEFAKLLGNCGDEALLDYFGRKMKEAKVEPPLDPYEIFSGAATKGHLPLIRKLTSDFDRSKAFAKKASFIAAAKGAAEGGQVEVLRFLSESKLIHIGWQSVGSIVDITPRELLFSGKTVENLSSIYAFLVDERHADLNKPDFVVRAFQLGSYAALEFLENKYPKIMEGLSEESIKLILTVIPELAKQHRFSLVRRFITQFPTSESRRLTHALFESYDKVVEVVKDNQRFSEFMSLLKLSVTLPEDRTGAFILFPIGEWSLKEADLAEWRKNRNPLILLHYIYQNDIIGVNIDEHRETFAAAVGYLRAMRRQSSASSSLSSTHPSTTSSSSSSSFSYLPLEIIELFTRSKSRMPGGYQNNLPIDDLLYGDFEDVIPLFALFKSLEIFPDGIAPILATAFKLLRSRKLNREQVKEIAIYCIENLPRLKTHALDPKKKGVDVSDPIVLAAVAPADLPFALNDLHLTFINPFAIVHDIEFTKSFASYLENVESKCDALMELNAFNIEAPSSGKRLLEAMFFIRPKPYSVRPAMYFPRIHVEYFLRPECILATLEMFDRKGMMYTQADFEFIIRQGEFAKRRRIWEYLLDGILRRSISSMHLNASIFEAAESIQLAFDEREDMLRFFKARGYDVTKRGLITSS